MKQEMNWLFNQPEARKAIPVIGARDLTIIDAVFIEANSTEEKVASYDKMIMYNSQQADQEAIEWMKQQVRKFADVDKRYLYFRFRRWN